MNVEITGSSPPNNPTEIVMEEAHKAMRAALALTEAEWKSELIPGVRGYRTGHMARSITNDGGVRQGNLITGTVGTSVNYARYLEFGTGLYGPRHQWIVPKTKKALRFPEPGNKGFTLAGRKRSGRAGAQARYIFAKRVRGIVPRRYARDAVFKAEPKVKKIFEAAARRAAERLTGSA